MDFDYITYWEGVEPALKFV